MTKDGEVSQFEPANNVELQLVAAATGDAAQQKAFERFILDETLYVATPEVKSEGYVTLEKDTNVKLLNVPLNDGRSAAAVFTSPQRIAEAFGDVGYIGIQGRVLFEIIRTSPAVLNPGQAMGVVWEPDALSAMLGLPSERVIQKDTEVLLGAPAQVPTDLVQRLKVALSNVPAIEAAWLALAAWPPEFKQSWYLQVHTSAADHEAIRRALPGALEGADMMGKHLDMVINSADPKDGVGIVVVESRRIVRSAKKGFWRRIFG